MPGWDTETYPNEIAYRNKDPGRFDKVRSKAIKGVKGVRMLYGRVKGSDEWEVQALRFDKDEWTLKEAKAWLKEHKSILGNKNSRVKINRISWKDNGDHVTFTCSFAASGVMNEGYRSPEETEKMAPFCNGMRVIIGHPPVQATGQMAALDLKDPEFPVVGWTSNVRAEPFDDEVRIVGDLNIYKVDREGNDRTDLIEKIKAGEVLDVSIGYFFDPVPAVGAHKGKNYNHLETDINPYHLAILENEEPACPGPTCGIGVAAKANCATCQCAGHHSHHSQHGGSEMPDPENPPAGGQEPRTVKAREQDISVADMSVDSIAGVNAHVKDLVDEKATLETKVKDLEKKVNDLEEAKKKGDEALAELDRQKAEEKKSTLKKIEEVYGEEKFKEIFGEKPEEKAEDFIASHLKVVESFAADETAPPEEAEGVEQNARDKGGKAHNELKINASATANRAMPPHHEDLTVGDLCTMYKPAPIVRRDGGGMEPVRKKDA